MKCEVCNEREAVCEIRGFKVCGDNFCKYDAWTFDPPMGWVEDLPGQEARVITRTKPATSAGIGLDDEVN